MADGEEEKKIVVAGAGGDEEEKQIVLAGAGDEEEENVGEGGGGEQNGNGNNGQFFPPPGFRFTPKDHELVRYYLLPKLQGREHVPNDAIIEDNVYQCHPDLLVDKYIDKGEDSWYFLSPRARKYHNGDRPSRNTDDNRGRWKASTGTKVVVERDAGGEAIKYSESVLAYHEGPIKVEGKSKWLMKELTVPEYEKKRGGGARGNRDMLDQYVMCKIYVTPRHKGDFIDETGPSGAQPEPAEGDQGTTAPEREKLSEKQAGKRPAKEQNAAAPAAKRAHHPNPDRLNLGPPAPIHGHGMQAPFRAPGYYGAPGFEWPMLHNNGQTPGYYPRAPVPRPAAAAYNGHVPRQQVAYNGQVQVPRQQVAHNGQVPVPRQQVAHNGQLPVPRQQVGFNGQVRPPVQRQQMAFHGQARPPVLKLSPPYRPAGTPSSFGQDKTMLTRPPRPAGQAVNPPASAVPRPAQTQRQPETDEMRTNRVLQQHMEEYIRMQRSTRPPASAAHATQLQLRRRPTAFTHQQQQRPMMAFTHQQQYQQQQGPYFSANTNYHHHAGAMVPQISLEEFYASEAAQYYQHSRVVPAMSGSAGVSMASAEGLVSSVVSGAGNEVSGGNGDCSNDEEMELVESAAAGGSASAADGEMASNMIGPVIGVDKFESS